MLFPFKESDVSQGLTSSILGEPGRFSLQYKYFSVSFLSASSWHWAREHSTSNSLICHSTHMNRSGWECQESAHFATETKIWGFFLLLCVCVGGLLLFCGFFLWVDNKIKDEICIHSFNFTVFSICTLANQGEGRAVIQQCCWSLNWVSRLLQASCLL